MKVAVLGSYTLDLLVSESKKLLDKNGIVSDWYIAPFNQYKQEILDDYSGLFTFEPDVILLSVLGQDLYGDPKSFIDLIELATTKFSSSTIDLMFWALSSQFILHTAKCSFLMSIFG